jgi:hypothetical protein
MSEVGFEPMIPAFEWAKTFHALDRAATVIGKRSISFYKFAAFTFSSHGILSMALVHLLEAGLQLHQNLFSSFQTATIATALSLCLTN